MIWSGVVRNVTLGQRSVGFLSEPIKSFSEMLSNTKKAYNHYLKAPKYYLKTKDSDKQDINNLNYDFYGLYSFRNGNEYNIELKNFRNNTIKHDWKISVEKLSENYEVGQNDRLYPVILMKNLDIIVSCNEKPGIIRMDSTSEQKWYNDDFIFHHAINLDSIGNIWIPGAKHDHGGLTPNVISIENEKHNYRDDLIVNIDALTGKTLYSKSLTQIF